MEPHVPIVAVAQDLVGEREAGTHHSQDVSLFNNVIQMPPGLHFPPCRTCVSWVDRMPAVMHFPPCRTCVSWVDRRPAVTPWAETGASREPFLDTGGQRNVQDQQHVPESRGPQNCRGLRPALHVPFLGAVRLLSDFAGLGMPAFAFRFLGGFGRTLVLRS